MPNNPVFTQSRLNSFMTCERLEWYQYQAGGKGICSAVPYTPFIEGEFGHYALKHWYANAAKGGLMLRDNMIKRIKKMIDDLGAIPVEQGQDLERRLHAIIGACLAYKVHYKSDLSGLLIDAVEKEFQFKLGNFTFKGVIDLAVTDKETKMGGFIEHKFLQSAHMDFASLPLKIQQLMYTKGYKALFGELPKWYRYNIIQKSLLRRKGMTVKKDGTRPVPEALAMFENRVMQQYMDDPAKMFNRTPPKLVDKASLEYALEQVKIHLHMWEFYHAEYEENKILPPMRLSSCEGKYNSTCQFGPACVACMAGSGEGWDAPECAGLYKKKDKQHMELGGKSGK